MITRTPNFFVAGGTLHFNAPSYVKRPADEILPRLVANGELCYVLNPRQMGKSSLMVRTIHALKEQKVPIQTVNIDLSAIGTTSIEQWYYSLVDEIAYQLKITTDVPTWWQDNASLEYVSRFNKFLRDIILTQIKDHIAIFFDEVDSVINYDFSDDFFAAIRALYNRRATDKLFERVTFILLGTVAPQDLIKDHTRTPFNVGQRIKLDELQFLDARVMLNGLPQQREAILERIFYWTNGHPYLTQKIGQVIAERNADTSWTGDLIDDLIRELFLTDRALVEESNLQFVRNRVLSSRQKDRLLTLYRQVYEGRVKVRNEEQSANQQELKLTGLVGVDQRGYLTVRNRIYKQTFDLEWIMDNQPPKPNPRMWFAVIIATFFLMAALCGYLWWKVSSVEVRVVNAIYTDQAPKIDGRLDDEVWSQAQPLTLATYQPENGSTTVIVKLLWDDNYLYAGFDVNDTQVEGSDTPWDGDSVSVIIENGLQVQEYRHSLIGENLGDRRGNARSEHYLKEGTSFNNATDEDVGYSVEMQIPLMNKPSKGSKLAADFLSVDHDQNPGGVYNDDETIFGKISWDGDQNVDTAAKIIQLLDK